MPKNSLIAGYYFNYHYPEIKAHLSLYVTDFEDVHFFTSLGDNAPYLVIILKDVSFRSDMIVHQMAVSEEVENALRLMDTGPDYPGTLEDMFEYVVVKESRVNPAGGYYKIMWPREVVAPDDIYKE
ncbi:hypothetical protein F5Y04DRAFT_280877 [Hypomontagnella monticulosa]|nr:hypothetical protein F5Y04DRAFT_280877 [Hypomontagnella monticulosa]